MPRHKKNHNFLLGSSRGIFRNTLFSNFPTVQPIFTTSISSDTAQQADQNVNNKIFEIFIDRNNRGHFQKMTQAVTFQPFNRFRLVINMQLQLIQLSSTTKRMRKHQKISNFAVEELLGNFLKNPPITLQPFNRLPHRVTDRLSSSRRMREHKKF
jgi:hypothetical protein